MANDHDAGNGLYSVKLIEELKVGSGLPVGFRDPAMTEVQKFLKRYYYLDARERVTSGVLCERTMLGITRLQRSRNIAKRQVLDEETRLEMIHSRCLHQDYSAAFAGRTSWKDLNLRYAFGKTAVQGKQKVPLEVFRASVAAALKTWKDTGVPFTFEEVPEKETPHFVLEWVVAKDHSRPGDTYDMSGRVIAHAGYPPQPEDTPDQPIFVHFDYEEHHWANGKVANHYDIETVALHEIGHVLGLEHSEVDGAVMFPTSLTSNLNRGLHDADLAALYSLYPGENGKPEAPRISLMASNGKFVCAESGGGAPSNPLLRGLLKANRDQIGDWEIFKRISLGADVQNLRSRIAFQVHNGQYVCAENGGGGEVSSNRPWVRDWEMLWVIPVGAADSRRFALQAYNDRFLQVAENGQILAKGTSLDERSTFLEIRLA